MIILIIMISNFEILGEELPPVTPSGFFGLSFLSWQGNKMSFADSSWMIYIIYAFVFLSCFFIFIFKDKIRANYQSNPTRVVNSSQIFAIFLLFLSTFRIIILGIGGYPNLWELIPLHFCRVFVILIGITLLFRKIQYVKYFGMFAIGGGFIGLAIPDLSNSEYWSKFGGMEIGIDNYVFWDYFTIHVSSIILPVYLFACLKPVFYKSEMAYTILIMWIATLTIFGLNLELSKLSDPRWRPNWFYLGIDELNGIDELLAPFLGPLVSYPGILFTFTAFGIIFYLGFTFIYINSDRIHFIWKDEKLNKFKFKAIITPSENMNHFIDGPFRYRKKYNLD